MHEAHEPNVVAHVFDADVLTGEHRSQVDLFSVVTDAAGAGDGGGPIMEG